MQLQKIIGQRSLSCQNFYQVCMFFCMIILSFMITVRLTILLIKNDNAYIKMHILQCIYYNAYIKEILS